MPNAPPTTMGWRSVIAGVPISAEKNWQGFPAKWV
jgi:hypothetical protein